MMDNNSQKNKQIARNTLFLYFRMLFIMCISLYTSRVILEALGVSDYGIYNVVGGFVAMFALISSSLTSACTRFLNYEMGRGSASRLRTVFSTSLTVHIILACIIALLCESFGVWYVNNKMVIPEARLIAANWVFQISVLNFCINLVTVPFNAAIIAHEKMSTFAYVSIFEGVSRLVICFLVMWISFDHLITYALLYMLVQVSVMAMYQVYCNRHFDECHYRFSIDKKLTKQMFSYSGWHGYKLVELLIPEGKSGMKFDYTIDYPIDPLQWFLWIKNAKAFCGLRFHAIVSSISNGTPFYSIDSYGDNSRTSKIFDFLGLHNLARKRDVKSKIYNLLQGTILERNRCGAMIECESPKKVFRILESTTTMEVIKIRDSNLAVFDQNLSEMLKAVSK